MKTAAIVYEFPSLSETFVLNQIEGMITAGCDVSIYADNPNPVVKTPEDVAPLLARVTYFGLPLKQLRESVGNIRSRFPSREGARSIGRRPSRRFNESGGAALRLKFEARAFGKQPSFDVVHAHFGPNGVRAIRLRAMGALAGPVLTSFYGYDVGRHWARQGYDQLFSKGEKFIALSEHMRKTLVSLGCPAERIIIHRLGLDPERFSQAHHSGSDRLEVVSIARLVPKKGIEYGIRAVAELAKRNVRMRYTIVGHGPLHGRLERIVRELDVQDSVVFAGPMKSESIPGLLASSDVLLAPSVTAVDGDAEGTPMAILEGHAASLPVVSTRHAGIPEIVEENVSGFLVPEGNVQDLAEKLSLLSESPSRRQSMGAAGRAFVVANHDIHALNRELFEIYKNLIR